MQRTQLEFSAASASSQGAREYQEDAIRIWYPDGVEAADPRRPVVLAVLADGMGGHVSGEVASKLVCDQSLQHFLTMPGEPEDKIKTVLDASNGSLERAIRSNSKLVGMGCTLVVAYLNSEGVRWASVGDSSLLLFRGGQLYRLNQNHSLGALLDKQAAAGLITYEEARNSPGRHSLRSALIGGPIAICDIAHTPQSVLPGDWVIIASDGLETLTGDEIATAIGRASAATPSDLARGLLDLVDRRAVPSQDNTSIIAVRANTGKTAVPRGDRQRHAGNGTGTPSDPNRDSGAGASMIHGTLIGQDKNKKRPRHPSSAGRLGGARLAALFVVFVLVSALFFVIFFEMLTSRISGGPNGEATEHSVKQRSKSR
jgi:serine/threonine protein phosphatase PrpC